MDELTPNISLALEEIDEGNKIFSDDFGYAPNLGSNILGSLPKELERLPIV